MTVPRLNPAGRFNPDSLFRPRSVAVIGASTEAGAQISANLSLGAFRGTVQSVEGVADLSAAPDLAVLAGPPETIVPALDALAAVGCYAALVPGPGRRPGRCRRAAPACACSARAPSASPSPASA